MGTETRFALGLEADVRVPAVENAPGDRSFKFPCLFVHTQVKVRHRPLRRHPKPRPRWGRTGFTNGHLRTGPGAGHGDPIAVRRSNAAREVWTRS